MTTPDTTARPAKKKVNYANAWAETRELLHKYRGKLAIGMSLMLPSILLRIGLWAIRWLDSVNLLPYAFTRPDPMYASLFVANLGSVKLESAFHHLYEYGNIPVFAAIGRNKKVVDVDENGQVKLRVGDEEIDKPGEGWRRHMVWGVKVLADFAQNGLVNVSPPSRVPSDRHTPRSILLVTM